MLKTLLAARHCPQNAVQIKHLSEEYEMPSRSQPDTPSIVIKGFGNLPHFLSWFQIELHDSALQMIQSMQCVHAKGDCIVISGFSDLNAFISFFSSGNPQLSEDLDPPPHLHQARNQTRIHPG